VVLAEQRVLVVQAPAPAPAPEAAVVAKRPVQVELVADKVAIVAVRLQEQVVRVQVEEVAVEYNFLTESPTR
jgi:hypothetical protein